CTAIAAGASCVSGHCAATVDSATYALGGTCGSNSAAYINYSNAPVYCQGADVLVSFPGSSSNYREIAELIDGVETFPTGTNRELRSVHGTPIAGSLDSVRDWLSNSA